MIKKLINAIIEKGDKDAMIDISDIFIDMLYDLKNTNKAWYNSIQYKMYELAYGEHLTESLARQWVDCMENKDGTKGEHWSYEQTEEVRKQYAPDLDSCDFYAILNMVYSDYYNEKFDTTTYIQLAKDWLNDEDIPNGKALKYYMFVVQ